MIKLSRLNGQELVINAELIELMEAKPDTIITLTTGEKFIVSDSIPDIIKKVKKYKREINSTLLKEEE